VRRVPADVACGGPYPGHGGGLHGIELDRRRLAARVGRGRRLHFGHRPPPAGGHARPLRDHAGRVGRVRGGPVRGRRLPRLHGLLDDPRGRRAAAGRRRRPDRDRGPRRAARDPPERPEPEADPVLLRVSPAIPRRFAGPARHEAARARRDLHAHDPRRVRPLRVRERRPPRPRARGTRRPPLDRARVRRVPDRVRRQTRVHGPV
ncbi:MAG: RhtB family transporter, partial [uncultured Rubrobacteraceae bacterium]